MSGDMCTSLGNGFTNLMLAKFIAHEQGADLHGFVEGDDGLFSTTASLTPELYQQLGFTIKIDEVSEPCKASFCGMVFAESGQIIRDPRKFMMTFAWTQSLIQAGPTIMNQLQRAKALSCLAETPSCPIVSAFATYALNHTDGYQARFVSDGYHQVPANGPKPLPIADDTRELFEHVFGIPVAVQLACEAAIALGEFSRVAELVPPTWDQARYARDYVVVT
jgi:hypothetical protein